MEIKKNLLRLNVCIIIIVYYTNISFGINKVNIDLSQSNSTNNIKVELLDLHFSNDKEILFFPSVIQGMYEKNDFGKYINNVYATLENGKRKKLKRKNINAFFINEARKVEKITYCVKSTILDNELFLPAGSFFNYNGAYLLNFHALVGYFETTLYDPFIISINKDESLFGIGSLRKQSTNNSLVDSLYAQNYYDLVDSPFLYSYFEKHDTTTIDFDLGKINIAIAPNIYDIDARKLKKMIEPILNTLKTDSLFYNSFHDSYSFLFCFSSENLSSQGALEHNKSSVYYLRDTNNLRKYLNETISHELLHVITPLHLRSSLIDSFNFNNPVFSKHLWLYEGVTEYLSLKCNLKAQIIDTTTFFKKLKSKFEKGRQANIPSLLEFSENILSKKNQLQYEAIYTKGCLAAFYLDFLLAKESNGRKGIFNLLDFALKSSNSNGVFYEEEFLDVLIEEFPEIKSGIQISLLSTKNIPFYDCLSYLGIAFNKSKIKNEKIIWDFGINKVIYQEQNKCIIIKKQPLNDSLGIKKLKIYKINGSLTKPNDIYTLLRPNSEQIISLTIKNKSQFEILNLTPFSIKREYYPIELEISNRQNKVLNKVLSFGLN